MRTWACRGKTSGQLWSYGGKVLVHPDRAVLEWLISPASADVVAVQVSPDEALDFRYHPSLAHLAWPERKVGNQ